MYTKWMPTGRTIQMIYWALSMKLKRLIPIVLSVLGFTNGGSPKSTGRHIVISISALILTAGLTVALQL
jgi:hypothetical protein